MPSGDFLGLKPAPSRQGFPAQLEGLGGCILAISLGCGWFDPPAPAHIELPTGQPSHKKVITGCLPKLVWFWCLPQKYCCWAACFVTLGNSPPHGVPCCAGL